MSDGVTLFVIISLLYVWECFVWIKKQTVAFISSWTRGHWKVVVATPLFGNARGSLVLMNPFSPFGSVLLSHLSPISLSPNGLCLYNSQSLLNSGRRDQPTISLKFDDITCCRVEGKSIIINNVHTVECGSLKQARDISELISAAISSSHDERTCLVGSFIAKRFAGDDVSNRLNSAEHRLKVIRTTCSVFFLFLFVLVPGLVIFSGYGLSELVIPVVIVMIGFVLQISVMFYLAHRELFPDFKEDRVTNLIKLVLCPPGAIRAADLLTADIVSSFDPVVVASSLSRNNLNEFVRSYIRDLKFPLKQEVADPRSKQIVDWYNNEILDCTLRFIKQSESSDLAEVFAAPLREDDCLFYCPRCQSQFNLAQGECTDCPGVTLIEFPTAPMKGQVTQSYG